MLKLIQRFFKHTIICSEKINRKRRFIINLNDLFDVVNMW